MDRQSVGAPFESATIRPIDSSIFCSYEVVSCKESWDHMGEMRVFMMTKIDLECSESYSCVTTHILCALFAHSLTLFLLLGLK